MAQLQYASRSSPILFWSSGSDSRIRCRNQDWKTFIGAVVEPVFLADLAAETRWEGAQAFRDVVERAFRGQEAFRTEFQLVGEDGTKRWLLVCGAPCFSLLGRFVGYLGCCIDVGDSINARIEAEQACAKLKDEQVLLDRFVAMLSHDLRTPLTAGRIGAQLIQRFVGDPNRVQALAGQVVRQIDRIDRMTRDVLDAARIRAGEGLRLEFVECDIIELCANTVRELRSLHGCPLALRGPESLLTHCCPEELRRALENLCGNAAKYGDSESTIWVTVAEDGANFRLSVRNEGRPIPASGLKDLFKPFQRLCEGASRKEQGWGLGLTLVRGVVEAHGGKVEVTSSEQDGTTFTMVLPRDARLAVAIAPLGQSA